MVPISGLGGSHHRNRGGTNGRIKWYHQAGIIISKKLDYYESGKAFESLKAKYEKEIIRLTHRLAASEAMYKNLSEKNKKNIAENNRLRNIISEKDSDLQDVIKEYEGILDEYKNLIDELRKQINYL